MFWEERHIGKMFSTQEIMATIEIDFACVKFCGDCFTYVRNRVVPKVDMSNV